MIKWQPCFDFTIRQSSDEIDINIINVQEFQEWMATLCELNCVKFSKSMGDRKWPTKTSLFYVCHHAENGQKGRKLTSTGYVYIDIIISNSQITITIKGKHNHSLTSAAALLELNREDTTTEEFHSYFEQGIHTRYITLQRGADASKKAGVATQAMGGAALPPLPPRTALLPPSRALRIHVN